MVADTLSRLEDFGAYIGLDFVYMNLGRTTGWGGRRPIGPRIVIMKMILWTDAIESTMMLVAIDNAIDGHRTTHEVAALLPLLLIILM